MFFEDPTLDKPFGYFSFKNPQWQKPLLDEVIHISKGKHWYTLELI